MDTKQSEAAADALIGELQRQQAVRSGQISSDSRALSWLVVFFLGVVGAAVGATIGLLGHHALMGAGIGFLAGLVSGSRRGQA
jgi:hypothetical protein